MRKIYVLAMALFALCAVSFAGASSALAVSKILAGGAEIGAGGIAARVTDEFLFEDMSATGKPDILCSKTWSITISAGGVTGQITAVLNLKNELVEDAATKGDLLECTATSTCSNPVDMIATNLPWNIEVVLVGGTFVSLILNGGAGQPGYTFDCNTIIGLLSDTCTGELGAILTNEAGGLLGEFSETNEAITTPVNCTLGGEKQGLFAGTGFLVNLSGTGALTVSE